MISVALTNEERVSRWRRVRVARPLAVAVLAVFPLSRGKTALGQSPFATRVMAYQPAPGANVNSASFNDPTRALGAPAGGGPFAADNSKVVTLGGFGGSITLGFDHPVVNRGPTPSNPHGLDLVVFGNAFFVGGDVQRRWAEAGVIEVSRDVNGNGLADDPWYVIAGSHLGPIPAAHLGLQAWDDRTGDPINPPSFAAWIPAGRSGTWTTTGFLLPQEVFGGPVVSNPLGPGSPSEGFFGYADTTPTMVLGDTDGDGEPDDENMTAERFYTNPDDPLTVGITRGSGGGDAIDISWAVNEQTGAGVTLESVDFVRITTGVNAISPLLGEVSTEVSGVAEVRPRPLADIVGIGGPPARPDGMVTGDDFLAFVNAFAAGESLADVVGIGGVVPPDGLLTGDDFVAFINAFAEGN